MTTFWLIAAAMIVAALLIVAPALLRRREVAALDRTGQNVQIAQERLQELETDLQNGVLTQEQFDKSRLELEQALLIDIDQPTDKPAVSTVLHGRFAFVLLALAVPLLSLALYAFLGSPQLVNIDPRMAANAAQTGKPLGSVEDMVKGLADRLKENPSDLEGWYLLGRSLMALERYDQAVVAFETAYKLAPDEPQIMLSLADALTLTKKEGATARAKELVNKALAVAPGNPTALWLGGILASSEGRHQEALDLWNKLRPTLDDDPQEQQQLDKFINDARSKLGMEPLAPSAPSVAASAGGNAAVGAPSIRVKVSLSAELAAKAQPDDLVFIYAKAVQGPRFPLAASRHRVKELPLEITLDDSSAMMPQAKLSGFQQVTVGARVSHSGDPVAKSGDLMGEVSPVAVAPDTAVEVVIKEMVP